MSAAITSRPRAHGHHRRGLTLLGTILAAMPLASGLAAGVTALFTPRFGGMDGILTTLWYVPMVMSPLALIGAAVLIVAVHAERRPRNLVIVATTFTVVGLVLLVALATYTGITLTSEPLTAKPPLPFIVGLSILTLMYLVGSVSLVALGARHLHGEPPRPVRHRRSAGRMA